MSEFDTAYVGTYTDDEETGGVYRLDVDPETGAMEATDTTDAGADPSFLAVHPSGEYLYAVNEAEPGTVTACAIDGEGTLSRIGSAESGGAGPCHLSVEATGEYVLVGDYSSGLVSMLPIHGDGDVGEPTHVVEHEGSSVTGRQTEPHVHSVTPGPENEVAYVADLGTDELVVYDMDLDDGRLDRIQTVSVHDGAGPRHVALHPDGTTLYLLNELDSTLVAYERGADGRLEAVATTSTLPEGFEDENYPAEVLVHPSGEYLYASNRGHDSVAAFELDEAGRAEQVGHVSTRGEWPRNIALSPDGGLLFAENQHTDDIHAFRVDASTGDLEPTGEHIEIPSPACMRFLA